MKRKKILNHSKGQVLPLVALTVLVLSMFSFLVWNIGRIEYNRQKAQTAADAAAISTMRVRASGYNIMSAASGSLGIVCAPIAVWHNKGKAFAPKEINGVPTLIKDRMQVLATALGAWNQSMFGSATIVGNKVAKANGAIPNKISYLGAITGTGLEGKNLTLYSAKFKIIYVYGIPVPIPTSIPKKEATIQHAYYARKWAPGRRNAQPDDLTVKYVATYPRDDAETSTFAGSLIGIGANIPKADAVACAKLYLNVNKTAKYLHVIPHNGGFPRVKSEGLYGGKVWPLIPGIEPISAFPMFEARLYPVNKPVPLMH